MIRWGWFLNFHRWSLSSINDTPWSYNDLGFQKYTQEPLKSRKIKLTGVIQIFVSHFFLRNHENRRGKISVKSQLKPGFKLSLVVIARWIDALPTLLRPREPPRLHAYVLLMQGPLTFYFNTSGCSWFQEKINHC